MELDAFTGRLGFSQGRILIEDDYVFVLGDDTLKYQHDLKIGDYVEVVQQTDLTDADFIRADLSVVIPDDLLPDRRWRISIVLDGNEISSVRCDTGRTRHITDLVGNVSKIIGVHEIGLRLSLVSFGES